MLGVCCWPHRCAARREGDTRVGKRLPPPNASGTCFRRSCASAEQFSLSAFHRRRTSYPCVSFFAASPPFTRTPAFFLFVCVFCLRRLSPPLVKQRQAPRRGLRARHQQQQSPRQHHERHRRREGRGERRRRRRRCRARDIWGEWRGGVGDRDGRGCQRHGGESVAVRFFIRR